MISFGKLFHVAMQQPKIFAILSTQLPEKTISKNMTFDDIFYNYENWKQMFKISA